MKITRLVLTLFVLAVALACGLTAAPGQPPAPTLKGPTSAPSTTTAPDTAVPASPTAFVPALTRITEPGCCVGPYTWSPDGQTVMYLDRPPGSDTTGIYGVSIAGGPPKLVSAQVGYFSADGKYLTFAGDKGQTVIRQLDGAVDHVIDDKKQFPAISPGDKRIAWTVATPGDPTIGTRADISVADLDGSNARAAVTLYDGGFAGWLDDDHLLVAGRRDPAKRTVSLFSIDVTTNAQVDIAADQRMRNFRVAPGGKWIMYAVTFDQNVPPDDGLWVVSADGSSRTKLTVPIGSAQWRDDHRLLVIPLEMGAASYRLWQYDAATGQGGDLTDPAATPFRVEAGNWSASPDGAHIVFLNPEDHALWLMTLPPGG